MATRTEFLVQGLHCAEEVSALKEELGCCAGVLDLSFDVIHSKMTVEFDDRQISPTQLAQRVSKTGMRATPWPPRSLRRPSHPEQKTHLGLSILSGVCLLAGLVLHVASSDDPWHALSHHGTGEHVDSLTLGFFLTAIFSGGWFALRKAIHAARRLRPDMNLLMWISIAGASFLGEWSEAASVAFLFSVASLLETWSLGRARQAIGALMQMAPQEATLLNNGGQQRLPVGQVPVGSMVLVKPGEKIPLDGHVRSGASSVNQAPITGESIPVAKTTGDLIFAGTINGEGALEIETTRDAANTTFANIVKQVQEASSRRAPAERWVETFARYYTPIMILLTLSIWLVPPLVLDGQWNAWFYRGLIVLVIACPCALVISTPVSIVAGLTSAARRGVLIKGGSYLEAASRLRAAAIDKTGVLTRGEPEVQCVITLNGHSEIEVLERVAALEMRSEHPLGKALVRYTESKGIRPLGAPNFKALLGQGAEAHIGGKRFWIGSHRLLHEKGIETADVHDRASQFEELGQTVVVFGDDHHVWALISIADGIRSEARTALTGMKRQGLQAVVMLTGDNPVCAQAVAGELGINEVRSNLLPLEKATAVQELAARHGSVAMIGDGVNDAPAMANATIGIALGTTGTDAALETAGVVIMSGDLSKVPFLIQHARRTLAIVKQNVTFALAAKAVFLVLAFFDLATLWMAIAADTGATLLVTLNGLRLLRAGPSPLPPPPVARFPMSQSVRTGEL
ncbi:MAG: heavy metal translocating P-type ATPase [Acidobacteriota bacterium]